MSIRIGTCSWAHKTLTSSARFYPKDVKTPEARLRFYASVFPTVEVDTAYYAIPSVENAAMWSQRTPEGFSFHVKAFRLFTGHWADVKTLPRDLREAVAPHANTRGHVYLKDVPADAKDALWQRFDEALRPIHAAGKVGSVLFQFPPWVPPARRVYEHLDECKARLPDYQIAVEFRNKAWFAQGLEETTGFLRERGLIYVAVDEPQGFPSSVPPVVDVTGPGAYLRFHGRNAAMWEAKVADPSERFDWWYTDAELAEWTPRIAFLEREAGHVTVMFNTNWEDQGSRTHAGSPRRSTARGSATMSRACNISSPCPSATSAHSPSLTARRKAAAAPRTYNRPGPPACLGWPCRASRGATLLVESSRESTRHRRR